MESSQVAFPVVGDGLPVRLSQPLAAAWYVPEPNATRLLVARSDSKGMRVFHDRRLPRGPVPNDYAQLVSAILSDGLYERLLAFLGVQPVLPDLSGDPPAGR